MAKYKALKFNIVLPLENGNKLFYNTVTTAMMELEPKFFDLYFSSGSFEAEINDEISTLLKQGFLKLYDEDEDYYQELQRKGAICSSLGGIRGLTISPTNRCNACCFYCYKTI